VAALQEGEYRDGESCGSTAESRHVPIIMGYPACCAQAMSVGDCRAPTLCRLHVPLTVPVEQLTSTHALHYQSTQFAAGSDTSGHLERPDRC
jgi:hypothetical protein